MVAGTRIPVLLVHARMQDGWSAEELREAYPRLTDADLDAVVGYGRTHPAHLADDLGRYERLVALHMPADRR